MVVGGAEVVVVVVGRDTVVVGVSAVGVAVVVGSEGGAASSSLLHPAKTRAATAKEKRSFVSVLLDFIVMPFVVDAIDVSLPEHT